MWVSFTVTVFLYFLYLVYMFKIQDHRGATPTQIIPVFTAALSQFCCSMFILVARITPCRFVARRFLLIFILFQLSIIVL
ncbi:hypothetical protein BJX62DRAFT_175119 [Aspergillus germanicus]